MWPVWCETMVTCSCRRARWAFSVSSVPLNHMALVTTRRLFVRMPSPASMKFCEWSGVARRKMWSSGIRHTMNIAAAYRVESETHSPAPVA